MRRRIFLSVAAVAAAALLAAFLLCLAVLDQTAAASLKEDLVTDMACIREGVAQGGAGYLEALELSERRITWIAADGTVLYDNFAAAETLENHGDRDEVQQALTAGIGIGERASETLGERTYYYAERLYDGSVLRLAARARLRTATVKSVAAPFAVIVLIAAVLSLLAGELLARRIMRPVKEMDFEHPAAAAHYPELSPLITRLNRQTRVIDAQRRQLREGQTEFDADEFRREFTANVSHELKTPLTAISGTAEILSNGIVRPDDVPHFAENIYKEAQRLIALVEDLMRLSQLDENRGNPERTAVDLHALAAEVLERLASAAQQSGVTLTLTGEETIVDGVERILDEIVMNLCDNALKYNREGGSVTVYTGEKDGRACLIVEDTGIGIPKAHQSRVFERFYRVDKSHSRRIGGTGLGLSIVKHGVAYHGGTIALESEPDKGTKITVTL